MADRYLRDQVRQSLKMLHVNPQRLMGQNFLCDSGVVRRIAAVRPLTEDEHLLEIGPGLGALTAELAESGARITGVELDDDLAAYLKAKFVLCENVEISHEDALAFDYISFNANQPYRVYANVPYSITTPLVRRLLLQGGNWQSLTLMLQKEAALRIVSGHGRSNGPLTVLADYFGDCRMLFDVPADCFWPQPKVNSAVIDIIRRPQPPVDGDICTIMKLVEAGFAERRKLMLNSLTAVTGYTKDYWQQALSECVLPDTVRAEQLTLEDFSRLSLWHERNRA